MKSSSLRSGTCIKGKVAPIGNALERHGLRVCSASQRIDAHTEPDLHVTNKNEELKRRSYRFQTENGGVVNVSIGAKEFTYAVHVEVLNMPSWFNEHNSVLRWQMLRSDSSWSIEIDSQFSAFNARQLGSETDHSSDILLTQTSPGRHTSELEINYSEVPFCLSFLIYSSFSSDGANGRVVRTARKTSFRVPVGFAPGNPMPLGVSFCDDGVVNFSLFSRNAERVVLCLFDDQSKKPSLEIDLDPCVHRTGDIWHASLENVRNYIRYGYRCDGDLLHNKGGSPVLLDPYAKVIRNLSPDDSDFSLSNFLGHIQKATAFDWSGDVRLCLPTEKLVVYRLNVGKFTGDESSTLSEDIAGTFSGIVEKIHHFKNLGVNAILLEPIFSFDEKQGPYFPYNFFAPMNMYGPKGKGESATTSMKEMVKSLHANGIEILLEVVFTHTAEGSEMANQGISFQGIDKLSYYVEEDKRSGANTSLNCNISVVQKMIIDSLRHWVIDFHIDGFCFVNASYFTQCSSKHHSSRPPFLSPRDMSYHEIDFPHWKRWSEINSKFCKDARNFLRGEGLLNSRGPACSFNFVTRNSGLSLVDLVSFSGSKLSSESSWNCGVEGPTSDSAILGTRLKQIRNFLFLLFVSLGVPVLNMGDECGLSNGGSTLYRDRCPFDWAYLETSFALQVTQFISFLSSLRDRRSDLFQRSTFHKVQNIQWRGLDLSEPKWKDPSSKFLALTLKADKDENDAPSTAVLPEAPERYMWFRLVDTGCPFPGFFSNSDDPDCCHFSGLESYELKPHTFSLFEAKVSS
ncbi:unnamed protein product [Spirodela intermedia]|uniref:Glycosyl hydrolase family 13 catalytic domain-containing protein n=1 Tax=Spirodela intermedia TaxID=51605 RepID=A0A7I8I8X4_SPIIN|nr:unnamed protein product [Spirodela intermedia]CAA6654126.1 unnamed protein product [Spirodela intermedia]